MDELTLNRIANQLGAALVNQVILQGQLEVVQAENAQLKAELAVLRANETEKPEQA